MIIGNEETAELIALIQHTLMTYSIAVTAGENSGIRLLLLMMILLGTVTDVTPDLSRDAGNASPASEGGQGMADPLSNLGAESSTRGVNPRSGSATLWFLNVGVRRMRTARIHPA